MTFSQKGGLSNPIKKKKKRLKTEFFKASSYKA